MPIKEGKPQENEELKDGGRNDIENDGDAALGFVEEEDYRALLADEGMSYEKE